MEQSIEDFVLEQLDKDDEGARWEPWGTEHFILARSDVFRKIVEWHKNWPVLLEEEPTKFDFNEFDFDSNASQLIMSISKKMDFITQEEFRTRFGELPPTAPLLREIAALWSEQDGYQEEWRVTNFKDDHGQETKEEKA